MSERQAKDQPLIACLHIHQKAEGLKPGDKQNGKKESKNKRGTQKLFGVCMRVNGQYNGTPTNCRCFWIHKKRKSVTRVSKKRN